LLLPAIVYDNPANGAAIGLPCHPDLAQVPGSLPLSGGGQ